jgi:hypothetical protein
MSGTYTTTMFNELASTVALMKADVASGNTTAVKSDLSNYYGLQVAVRGYAVLAQQVQQLPA